MLHLCKDKEYAVPALASAYTLAVSQAAKRYKARTGPAGSECMPRPAARSARAGERMSAAPLCRIPEAPVRACSIPETP